MGNHRFGFSWGILVHVGVLVLVSVSCVARTASAEEEFPGPFSEAAGYECPAPCTLCHTIPQGGKEYLTLFGAVVWGSGVMPGKPETLAKAVATIRANTEQDTDGDGTPDWKEFELQTDPSRPNSPLYCPTYGCGASVAPPTARSGPTRSVLGVLGALIFVVVLATRRRRESAE
ncbi:MAG TPA: hypothetical protein VIM73_14280 [Polyangiaceae bacterium]